MIYTTAIFCLQKTPNKCKNALYTRKIQSSESNCYLKMWASELIWKVWNWLIDMQSDSWVQTMWFKQWCSCDDSMLTLMSFDVSYIQLLCLLKPWTPYYNLKERSNSTGYICVPQRKRKTCMFGKTRMWKWWAKYQLNSSFPEK